MQSPISFRNTQNQFRKNPNPNTFYSPQRPNTTQGFLRSPEPRSNNIKDFEFIKNQANNNISDRPLYEQLDKLLLGNKTYKTKVNFNSNKVQGNKYGNLPSAQRNMSPQQQYNSIPIKYTGNNNYSPGKQTKTKTVNGTKLSSIIYHLGPLAQDLMYFIDNSLKIEQQTNDLISRNKTNEFLHSQRNKQQKLMNIYQKYLQENGQTEKENEGFKQIGNVLKKEIQTLIAYYEKFILNVEENLQKINLFQEKEIIIPHDFYQGIQMLIECYNYQYIELGSFGKVRPDLSVYIKSIFQFKSLLKTYEKNQRPYELFEQVEELVKSQFERIDSCITKIKDLEDQNKSLTNICQKLQMEKHENNVKNVKKEKDIYKQSQQTSNNNNISQGTNVISSKTNQYDISSLQENLIQSNPQSQAMNNHILELKKENRRLHEALAKALNKATNINIGNLENNKSRLGKDGSENKDLSKLKQFTTATKGVQCTYVSEIESLQKKQTNYGSIIVNPVYFIKSSTLQSKEWVSAVTNMIFHDKLISELYDEGELRPRQSLQQYISEWFLRRFGTKQMGEVMLKDYLFSLSTFGNQHERLKLLCEMSQLDSVLQDFKDLSNFNKEQGLSKLKFRQLYLQTNEALYFYIKIAVKFRALPNYSDSTVYLPLFPVINTKNMDLVSFQQAKKIWDALTTEEQLTQLQEAGQLEELLRQQISLDISQRKQDNWGVYSGTDKDEDEKYIRFDTLARVFLNQLAEQRFGELEELVKRIKFNIPKHDNFISFTEYQKAVQSAFAKKSQRWTEISYKYLVDAQISEKTPIHVAAVHLTKILYDDYNVKENILKIKGQLLLKDDKSGNVKPQQNLILQKETTTKMKSGTKSIFGGPQSIANKQALDYKLLQEKNNDVVTEKEKIPGIYDHVNSIILIDETYKLLLSLVNQLEKKNEELQTVHERFKQYYNNIPSNPLKMQNYQAFSSQDKKEFMANIQQTWQQLRKIIVCISRIK